LGLFGKLLAAYRPGRETFNAIQVLDVVYPARKASSPFALAKFVFWAGLAVQGLLIGLGLGLWQMECIPIESLGAIPFISHLGIAAMLGHALLSVKEKPKPLWIWFITGLVASVVSLGLGIAVLYKHVEGTVLGQCIICVGVLAVKSWRDLKMANNGDKVSFTTTHANQQHHLDLELAPHADLKALDQCSSESGPGSELLCPSKSPVLSVITFGATPPDSSDLAAGITRQREIDQVLPYDL
jgi:hypothetical protein